MAVEDVTFCIVPIPGPAGASGADGTNGANGLNAYTTTTAAFTMPAEGANVTISVVSNEFAVVNQILAIQAGASFGHFSVVSKSGTTSLTVQNLENTASGLYTSNSVPGATFASGSSVSPAGLQGPQGSAAAAGAPIGATYITQTPHADLTNEQSLSGLATGLLINTTGTGVLSIAVGGIDYYGPNVGVVAVVDGGTGSPNAPGARTNLGLAIGTNVQAFDATLQSISSLGTVADRYAYTTGVDTWAEGTITTFARTLLDDVDASTMRTTLGVTNNTFSLLVYRHQATAGSNGGSFNSPGWQTVPLTTEVVDTASIGSLSSNQITLPAGSYRFRYGVVANSVGDYQGRLYDVTASALITNDSGAGTYTSVITSSAANTTAIGVGRFTLGSTKTIRIEAACDTTVPTTGFGAPGSFAGSDEVWSWIELIKE